MLMQIILVKLTRYLTENAKKKKKKKKERKKNHVSFPGKTPLILNKRLNEPEPLT